MLSIKSKIEGISLKLGGELQVDNMKNGVKQGLSKNTLYKILDCQGVIDMASLDFSKSGFKIFGTNDNNDIESADVAMVVLEDANGSGSYLFLLTLKDIGGVAAPYLARVATPNILGGGSRSVDGFLSFVQNGVLLDAHAKVFKTGNMTMMSSSDSLNGVDNLIGFSYQNTPSSTYGVYARYDLAQKSQIDNFAAYMMTNVGGFKIFNTISYQGLEDKYDADSIVSKSQMLGFDN